MGSGKRRVAAAPKWHGSPDLGAALLEAIAASPDDRGAWDVYADLLQTEGHPRGDLVSLMLEREATPSARLFEAERRHLGLHGAALAPPAGAETVVAWRRGFPSELRLDASAQLSPCAQAAFAFVEAVTLVVGDWAPWAVALAGMRLPWRRVRLEATGAIALAPLLAACPGLAQLRIVGAPALDWRGARSETLWRLVLADAGEVDTLDNAALPNLDVICLLGAYGEDDAVRVGDHAKRVVLASANAPLVPDVPVPPEEARYDDQYDTPPVAFLVVGRAVEAAVVHRLLARMALDPLAARIGVLDTLCRPATVIQLFGALDIDHLPYGLAIALQAVLPGAPPIALVEADADRAARYLVLSDPPLRGTLEIGAEAVRRALDIVLGCDPGPTVLAELVEALAALPIERLRGDASVYQLSAIDPSTAPVGFEPDTVDHDEDEEYEESEEYEGDDDLEAQYVEPIAPPEEDDAPELDDLELAGEPALETEEALALPPDRTELWTEFHEHWEDRALAIDDEPSEARWPDPARASSEAFDDLERRVAPAACARHARALDHCGGCGSMFCVECGGEDLCTACFAASIVMPEAASSASSVPGR